MRATLKYSLYRRPQSTNEVAANGFLLKGTLIDIDYVSAGAEIDGISIWFHSTDGFFYWGGGVKAMEGTGFFSWNVLSFETQQAVLASIVNDDAYWLEKNVIGLLGQGVGYKNDETKLGLALSIFVDTKIPSGNLPKTITYTGIEGIPIDVKPVQKIEHHVYTPGGIKNLQPDAGSPMQMGGSVAVNNSKDYGTRSLVLTDNNNNTFLMTCFHVLLDNFKSKGIYPFQGSSPVVANYPSEVKNTTGKKIRKLSVIAGRYTNNYDFALIRMEDNTDLRNAFDSRVFNGFYTSTSIGSLLNKEVSMAGATSIMQKGKVLETKATIFVGSAQIRFDNVIVTEKISMPGDSGAPVIDESNKIVGIIIAGNEIDRSFVLPIHNIIFQQGYTIAI